MQFYQSLQAKDYEKCRKNSLIHSILKRIEHPRIRHYYCDALIKGVAVDINGDIYPCHRFVSVDNFKLGNVNEINPISASKIANFKFDFNLNNHNACDNCWAVNLCGGGCPYVNYICNKNCKLPNTLKCEVNKSLFSDIIILYLKLTDEEKHALQL